MAVMMPREKWTDERLEERFDRLDRDIRELRGETKELRTEMNARFDAINASINGRFDAMNDSMNKRFDRLQYTLIGTAVAIAIAIIGSGAF